MPLPYSDSGDESTTRYQQLCEAPMGIIHASILFTFLAITIGCGKAASPTLSTDKNTPSNPITDFTDHVAGSVIQSPPPQQQQSQAQGLPASFLNRLYAQAYQDMEDPGSSYSQVMPTQTSQQDRSQLIQMIRQKIEELKPKIQDFVQQAQTSIPACKSDLATANPQLAQSQPQNGQQRMQKFQSIMTFFQNSQQLSPQCQQFTQQVSSLKQNAQSKFGQLKSRLSQLRGGGGMGGGMKGGGRMRGQ